MIIFIQACDPISRFPIFVCWIQAVKIAVFVATTGYFLRIATPPAITRIFPEYVQLRSMRFHRNIHGCRRQLSTAQGAGATLTFMKVHLRVLLIYWLRVLTSRLKYAGLYPCSQLYIGNTQRYQLVLHRSLLVSIHLRIVVLDVPAADTCPPSGMKYSPKVGATTTVGANVSLSLLTEMDGGLITIGTRNAHCSGALTPFGVPIVGISMRSFKCTTITLVTYLLTTSNFTVFLSISSSRHFRGVPFIFLGLPACIVYLYVVPLNRGALCNRQGSIPSSE